MIETIVTILAFIGTFFAGWLVATDKNRNEIFKRKVEAYQQLMNQLSKTLSSYMGSHISTDAHDAFVAQCIALAENYIANSLFISAEVKSYLSQLFSYKDWNEQMAEENINAIHRQITKELKLDHADLVNEKLLSLPLDILAEQLASKMKTKEKC